MYIVELCVLFISIYTPDGRTGSALVWQVL